MRLLRRVRLSQKLKTKFFHRLAMLCSLTESSKKNSCRVCEERREVYNFSFQQKKLALFFSNICQLTRRTQFLTSFSGNFSINSLTNHWHLLSSPGAQNLFQYQKVIGLSHGQLLTHRSVLSSIQHVTIVGMLFDAAGLKLLHSFARWRVRRFLFCSLICWIKSNRLFSSRLGASLHREPWDYRSVHFWQRRCTVISTLPRFR